MPNLEQLIEDFYRLNYSEKNTPFIFNAKTWAGNPSDMIVSEEPEYRRVEWKLKYHRPDINPQFEELEKHIGHNLPYSFKLWQSRYFTLNGFAHLLYLPISPSNYPLYGLKSEIVSWSKDTPGLIPFGGERNGDGPICFDVREAVENDDYPIVYWDHDTRDEWRISPPIFSSFSKLLECCVYFLSGDSTPTFRGVSFQK